MNHNHPHLHIHANTDVNHLHIISDTEKTVENFIQDICAIYQNMEAIVDYSPQNINTHSTITTFLSKLKVNFSHEETYVILNDFRIKKIQDNIHDIMSKYEFEVEIEYVKNLISGTDKLILQHVLNDYYNSAYDNLIKEEVDSLYNCCSDLPTDKSKLNIIFIGSGPFPASALVLHKILGAKITCIDIDSIAVDLSRKLIDKLDLNDEINIIESISDIKFTGNEIIWIANLVFDKQNVILPLIEKIPNYKSSCIFVIRSSEGLKTLRYKAVNENDLFNMNLKQIGIKNPDINLNLTTFYKLD